MASLQEAIINQMELNREEAKADIQRTRRAQNPHFMQKAQARLERLDIMLAKEKLRAGL